MRLTLLLLGTTAILASCATPASLTTSSAPQSPALAAPQEEFFARLFALCGQRFEGRLITESPLDADFAGKRLLARAGPCTDREVRIAFDVGEDASRTWIVTRQPTGLRLKHRHMLKDGTEDPVSQYGGDTATDGTVDRQEFPVDEFSKAMFTREGRTVSNTNVWAFEVRPQNELIYELARPGRLFRVRFDLTKPTPNP